MNRFCLKSVIFVFIQFCIAGCALAHVPTERYSSPLDRNSYYLHEDAMAKFPRICKDCKALVLGGDYLPEAMNLIRMGWKVSLIDKGSYSSSLLEGRLRLLFPSEYKYGKTSKRLEKKASSIADARPSGKHDYVLSFFGVPYEDKTKVLRRVRTLGPSIKKKGIFAVNFLGEEATHVKQGKAFAMSEKEIRKTFRGSGYEILYLVRRNYSEKDNNGDVTVWDTFDVIAQKK